MKRLVREFEYGFVSEELREAVNGFQNFQSKQLEAKRWRDGGVEVIAFFARKTGEMLAALEVLDDTPGESSATLLFSDMLETGVQSDNKARRLLKSALIGYLPEVRNQFFGAWSEK